MLYTETPEIHMHTLKIGVLDVSDVEAATTSTCSAASPYPRLQAMAPLRYQLVDIPLKLHHPMWVRERRHRLRLSRSPGSGARARVGAANSTS